MTVAFALCAIVRVNSDYHRLYHSLLTAALLTAGVQQIRLAHRSVCELPGPGTTSELLAAAGSDATHITSAAAALIDE